MLNMHDKGVTVTAYNNDGTMIASDDTGGADMTMEMTFDPNLITETFETDGGVDDDFADDNLDYNNWSTVG